MYKEISRQNSGNKKKYVDLRSLVLRSLVLRSCVGVWTY